MLILDSGAVTALAERGQWSVALIEALRAEGLWPPIVPTPVLIECLRGDARDDARTNRFLKTCDIAELVPEHVARAAARLRTEARRGSAVDALTVAMASPHGSVLTGDAGDIRALAVSATGVRVRIV